MQKLDQFDTLLAQSDFVQKKVAEGKEKGLIEGEQKGLIEGKQEGKKEGLVKGHIEALHQHILRVVSVRFPQLTVLAQQKVEQAADFKMLDELFNEIVVATDEQAVRTLLDTFQA